MESTSTSSMEFLLVQEVQFLEVKDDAMSHWEFVNVLDAVEEEEAEKDDDERHSVQNVLGSLDSSISWSISPNSDPIHGIHYCLIHPDVVNVKPHRDFDDDNDNSGDRCFDDVEEEKIRGFRFGDGDAGGYGGEQADEEEDDYNGYDLNDELVPWSVSSKFGRQRMRKLGKRAFSKMHNSKRLPNLFVRPGCVRGKHGLGLKHND